MPRRKAKRVLTLDESWQNISSIVQDYPMMNFANHREFFKFKENVFRFTVDIISMDFLISLMEIEEVKDVYFNPAFPPPGGGTDSISLRYKIYVEYHKI